MKNFIIAGLVIVIAVLVGALYVSQKSMPERLVNVPLGSSDDWNTFRVCNLSSSDIQTLVHYQSTGDEGESVTRYYAIDGTLLDITETCGVLDVGNAACKEARKTNLVVENCQYTTQEFFEEYVAKKT